MLLGGINVTFLNITVPPLLCIFMVKKRTLCVNYGVNLSCSSIFKQILG